MEDFSLRLAEVIRCSGKKQVEIANAVHISKQCISDFKSGKSNTSIHTIELLCKFLEVSTEYLLGLNDECATCANKNKTYDFEYSHGDTKLIHREKK